MNTNTPWRIGDAGHTVFGPPNGNPSPFTVASCLDRTNAAHIVRCVNAHDELVAALAAVVANIDRKPNQDLLSFQNVRALRAVLAKLA